jgi:hypothetical protein
LGAQRPNYVAGCDPSAGAGTAALWFKPACFELQAVGTLGNLGRNTGTAPGFVSTDVALMKNTRITERVAVQFRAEFFNLFNHTNLGVPSTGVFTQTTNGGGEVAPNAGSITSIVGTPRQIQFWLKIQF